jgi:hypothetical protein
MRLVEAKATTKEMCDTSACGPDCQIFSVILSKMEHRFDAQHKLVSTQTIHKSHTFAGTQKVSKSPVNSKRVFFQEGI